MEHCFDFLSRHNWRGFQFYYCSYQLQFKNSNLSINEIMIYKEFLDAIENWH
jgi:hypothetical protein